jgi:uncharacterized protein YjbI with pentapeptide repeats
MANEEHLALLKRGVGVWNTWRNINRKIRPDLGGAYLYGANLHRANLRGATLQDANLGLALLDGVNLHRANLHGATLQDANLGGANLRHAILSRAYLSAAHLCEADLSFANLSGADLSEADLTGADLIQANLCGVNLSGANLTYARLDETVLTRANLTGCTIYGISAWELQLVGATQSNLIITRQGEPEITVDNLEVAQFIYLLLRNEKLRAVIDTITSKAVLILGRFTPKRKAVLDGIRETLRAQNYVPILFDFDIPATHDITATVTLLARMARFIIADLTEPSSIPKELEAIVPTLAVPVQPLLKRSQRAYSMFQDYWKYSWVLTVYRYDSLEGLLSSLREKVIVPAEAKARELEEKRRAMEAELMK